MLAGWEVQIDEDEVVWEGPKVPELADVLDACAEQDIDPTAEDEEDEEPELGGSVVAEKYREEYRLASSTGQGCGDWLNEWLNAKTLDADNKKDMVAFDLILRNNGVDPTHTKWGRAAEAQTRGWQGRYAMSGRIALEKPLAK